MVRLLATACMWVFLVSACSVPGDEHLVDETPPESTPTQTHTESHVNAPLRPAMQQSAQGAEAQVRYALEVIEHAKETGNTKALLELSREACIPCADALDAIRAGRPADIATETVQAGATTVEGKQAQVNTLVTGPSGESQRSWRLNWEVDSWAFGALVGIDGF